MWQLVRSITAAGLFLGIVSVAAYGAGAIDTSFNAYLAKAGTGTVYRSAVQPDGKIVITGDFLLIGSGSRSTIARLNPDGTRDVSFNPPASITGLSGFQIETLGVQSTGKIVIGGVFQQFDGVVRQGLARLNADGSLDTAFNSNTSLDTLALVHDLEISSDDKIIFAGIRNGGVYVVTRLNADGSLNAEGAQRAFRIALQPDGKAVVFNDSIRTIERLNQDLTHDNGFTQPLFNNAIYAITVQPDGKIIVGGIFTKINGTDSPSLARFDSSGSVDVPYITNAAAAGGNIQSILNMPGGKVLVGGGGVKLVNVDGTVDPSFVAPNNFSIVYDLVAQGDGKIIAGGNAASGNVFQSPVVRLNADGSYDLSFQPVIGDPGTGMKVYVQPDNKILVTGDFSFTGGVGRHHLVRFNADGTVDTTFNQTIFSNPVGFDVLPDGKIVAYSGNTVARLNSDGTQDILFPGAHPGINDVRALPDGRVLISRVNNLERYNTDGTLDTTFNVPVTGSIYTVRLQTDGKILIGGSFDQVNGTNRSKIARLNADGTLDLTFDSPSGGITGVVLNIALSPGGKIVMSGTFSGISFNTRQGLARLNSDGSLDLGFVPPPSFSLDFVRVQPDGKVLLGGVNSGHANCYRLNADGTLDTTFSVTVTPTSTSDPRVRSADLQSDGKIIIAGDFLKINGVVAQGIARLLNSSRVFFDYDGDSKADISVFRPSENKWYIMRSSDGVVTQQIFAIAGDVPVPADYDGDGKTDLAIFRPSTGDWWSLNTTNGAQVFAHWGANGDVPRPSDFDGDGRADYIVFRPSDNNWYRISSSTGTSSNGAFGLAGDKPVTGDFDGDGKSDKAIYRPSTGDWWWQSSVNGAQLATHWGISTDIPAAADYDGDGKTDFAVYRPANGTWYVLNSSNQSSTILNFGILEDKPIPGDFDGDGKADIAVFRPSTGIWYTMRTTQGFSAVQFGVSSDVPTENAFVP